MGLIIDFFFFLIKINIKNIESEFLISHTHTESFFHLRAEWEMNLTSIAFNPSE